MTKLVPDLSRLLGFTLAAQSGSRAGLSGSTPGKNPDLSVLTGAKIGKLPSPPPPPPP